MGIFMLNRTINESTPAGGLERAAGRSADISDTDAIPAFRP
jgi:hypothetical protein